jgi:hypothetical protein
MLAAAIIFILGLPFWIIYGIIRLIADLLHDDK